MTVAIIADVSDEYQPSAFSTDRVSHRFFSRGSRTTGGHLVPRESRCGTACSYAVSPDRGPTRTDV